MTTPQIQNDPIYTLPFLYKSGLVISNDATTAHTVLDISAGQCRDSNDVMDITLGSTNANLEGSTVAAPLLLNAAVNGVNGLDTGTFAEATMYAIYMIADSRYYQQTACIATLASNSAPLMPYGYDSYRLIGYWATQTSNAYWQVGYYTSSGGTLSFVYDTFQATSITSGNATSYTAVDLVAFVPPMNNCMVNIYTSFTPNAAGHVVNLQGFNASGAQAIVSGQVAHVVMTQITPVPAQINASNGHPEINYEVTNSSDAVAIDVAGFTVSV